MKKQLIKYTSGLLAIIMGLGIMAQIPSFNEKVHAETTSNTDNLKVNKTSVYNKEDNSYTVSLNAYTTGNVEVITKSKPMDIVLVLDQSGSMNEQMAFDTVYKPAYYDGGSDANIDINKTYYIQKAGSSDYIAVTSTGEIIDYIKPSFKPIYDWKDKDGNYVVPKKKDGSAPINTYPAYQFFEKVSVGKGPTKLDSLKAAAKSFVNNVVKDGGDHRIAVAGFATGDVQANETDVKYVNTGLYIGSTMYGYNSASITDKYSEAYQSVKDANSLKRLDNSIDALQAFGATRADLGMKMADNILSSYAKDTTRNKIIVMFTDGVPTNRLDFEEKVANDTIKVAKDLKDKGAIIYSLGVVDTLDNTQNPASSSTNNLNRYMHYVSSNYPKAISLSDGGTGDYTEGKFLAATDEDSLKKMFSKINEEISSTTTTLNEKTILKDDISDYFTLKGTSDIKVYTQDYLGNDKWGEKVPFANAVVNIDEVKKSVSVSGFNYKENYIVNGQTPKGKRLVVDLKVNASKGFIGGNTVDTNKKEAGIYDGDTLIKAFPMPKVDVPLDFKGNANDVSIYLTQNIKNPEAIFDVDADVEAAGIQFQNSKGMATLDGINNKFVDIEYVIKNEKDEVIGQAIVKAGTRGVVWTTPIALSTYDKDTFIKVETIVKPVTAACGEGIAAKELRDTQNAMVYVFKPQVTFENSVVFLGEKMNLKDAVTGVNWEASKADITKPAGTAPVLTYTYLLQTAAITNTDSYAAVNDTEITVKVMSNNKDITSYTKLINANKPQNGDFMIKVLKGELAITKKVNAPYSVNQEIKANQTFIFKIEVRDPISKKITRTFYESIDFDAKDFTDGKAEKSVTLKGLEQGMYTITEESAWSWKYTQTGSITNYKNEKNTLYIGEKYDASAKYPYFGIEKDTKLNTSSIGNPGTIEVTNEINNGLGILGDCANAINRFMK